MNYKNMIPRCFGCEDYKFALHPTENKHAAELLLECVNTDVQLSELNESVSDFLNSKITDSKHITAQLARVDELFGVWLEP